MCIVHVFLLTNTAEKKCAVIRCLIHTAITIWQVVYFNNASQAKRALRRIRKDAACSNNLHCALIYRNKYSVHFALIWQDRLFTYSQCMEKHLQLWVLGCLIVGA